MNSDTFIYNGQRLSLFQSPPEPGFDVIFEQIQEAINRPNLPNDTVQPPEVTLEKLTKEKVNNVLRKLDEPMTRGLQFLATAFAPTGERAGPRGLPHSFNVDIKAGNWRLASFSGTADVVRNEITNDIKVNFSAAWWLRTVGSVIGVLVGFSIPHINGNLSGVDDHGRLLLTGVAQGFHYIESKPIDAVLTGAEGFERWDTGVPSHYRTTAIPTMSEDINMLNNVDSDLITEKEMAVWFSRQTAGGVRQALIYNGPFRRGVSYGPVFFQNFPLSVGARLGLGLNLPI